VRTAFGQQFDVPDGYLNTASIGVPPACAGDAIATAVDDWRRRRRPVGRRCSRC